MYCRNCGNKLNDNAKFCDNCGNNVEENKEIDSNKLVCPHCGSTNVQVQIVSENQSASCLTMLLYIILALTVVGIPIMIIILLLKGKKTTNRKYYVCQNCGKNFNPLINSEYLKKQMEYSPLRIIIAVFVILGLLILALRYSIN